MIDNREMKFYAIESEDINGHVCLETYAFGWKNALTYVKLEEEPPCRDLLWIAIRGAYIDESNGLLQTDIDNDALYYHEFNVEDSR